MEKIIGYARIVARIRIKEQINKPLLGKPYLKYGQCHGLWGYFFHVGGILGARHATDLDAFGHAFLGTFGPAGAVKEYFTELSKRLMADFLRDSMTFADYVGAEFIARVGYVGDSRRYFIEHGMDKLPPKTAEDLAWQYSEQGAALGAVYPHRIREMFDQTYTPVQKEHWEKARAAGLDIPPEQDLVPYAEMEKGENDLFMAYCHECCPELYSILNK